MSRESASIYAAGLIQGIALVAFPASSTILTDPHAFHLTSTQYGSLFIPQALLSILAALLNPLLCRRLSAKTTFTLGLTANVFSMALLALSVTAMGNPLLAYGMLMLATSCLGMGFGLVVPTINRMVEELYPGKSDAAVLTLNALLGVGTALAPVFIALFSALGFWWGLPLGLTCTFLALTVFTLGLDLPEEQMAFGQSQGMKTPSLAWVFAAFAFLYGIIETLNGNWISIYMSKHLGASINIQSLALTAFWGMVTFGRMLFAALSKVLSEQTIFEMAPFLSALSFLIVASLVPGQEYGAVIAFGLTGFGCSVLLPLLISFGGRQLKRFAPAVPGMIISSYLLGYGVAAFGVGPLESFGHVSLRVVYGMGSMISLILGMLSLAIVRKGNKEILDG